MNHKISVLVPDLSGGTGTRDNLILRVVQLNLLVSLVTILALIITSLTSRKKVVKWAAQP
jgi:hypothetical protein